MRTAEEVAQLYADRQRAAGRHMKRARQVRDAVNGDVVLPLPEMDPNEMPLVANLIQIGLDQTAMRVSSVMANVTCPPTKEGQKRAEDQAAKRRRAMLGWWEHNTYDLLADRRARHYFAYASTPVLIRPCPKAKAPRWVLGNPLGTFPAETTNPDDVEPDDAIFAFRRTWGWLRRNYDPDVIGRLRRRRDTPDTDAFECLEYVDADQHMLVVTGSVRESYEGQTLGGAGALALHDLPNRAGICTAVCPGRVSLDRPVGAFDGTLGLYQNQAMLLALQFIAVKKDVFSDTYLVSRQGETAKILKVADGVAGVVGQVEGGDIKDMHHPPGYQTAPMLDYLERGIRMAGGIPAEMTGLSATNVRTARRGDAILSATVDFTVQAAHKVLARSGAAELKRAVAVDKAYFGNVAKSFYVSWKGAKGRVDYTPNALFDTDECTVSYAHAGADQNSLVVGLGQRVGVGTLSKRTAAELDPLIDDADQEHDRTQFEAMESSILAELSQPGAMTLPDKARVMQLVLSDKMELAEAVLKVHEEAQQRQASDGAPGEPNGPVAPGSPEAQSGIAPAGMGAEQPAVGPPEPSVTNLAALLGQLHKPEVIARSG